MNRVELLSPAGNFDCLKAAINNGANAVYLGGKNFSARAFANNFDKNELIEAVNYAHLRNVKVYVTLNTLLTEKEFNNAIKDVEFYYSNNVDALLIQDLGLYYYIKSNYPDFEIHCSTQMHVHNLDGVKTAKSLGFKRVVLARESNLEFIKEACKEDIEIETFIHGAICVSYSGQCLMSSVTKNRSANKGMCAQCCRLKYDLIQNDKVIKTDTDYLLSPKDMCLIDDIPSLIEAGVSSFKIEGRLKSPAYVGYVTSLYRKAIDSYYNHSEFKLTDDEFNNLKVLFNRNFTNDYLYNKNDLFGQITPNHLGICIGNAFKHDKKYTYIKLNDDLNQFDGIRINDYGMIVNKLYKDGLLVNSASKEDIVYIESDDNSLGNVYKTLDYKLENNIINIPNIKIPIDINITLKENQNAVVNIKLDDIDYTYTSDIVCQKAINSPLDKDTIINSFSKLNNTVYVEHNITINADNVFLPIKHLNEIRRQAIDNFNQYRLSSFKRHSIEANYTKHAPVYDEKYDLTLELDALYSNNDKYDLNYVINPKSIYSNSDNVVISEVGGLLKPNKNKIAYYTLNCCNSYCYEFLKILGFNAIIVSTELNSNDISDLIAAYKQRLGRLILPYTLKQGNRVLMYIKANPFNKYLDNMYDNTYLSDGHNKYLLNINDKVTEIIENRENNINKQVFTIFK